MDEKISRRRFWTTMGAAAGVGLLIKLAANDESEIEPLPKGYGNSYMKRLADVVEQVEQGNYPRAIGATQSACQSLRSAKTSYDTVHSSAGFVDDNVFYARIDALQGIEDELSKSQTHPSHDRQTCMSLLKRHKVPQYDLDQLAQ